MTLLQRICRLKNPLKERYPKCINVPENMVRKPDPCIYSQGELATSPELIKWENIDIRLFNVGTGGFVRSTFDLEEGSSYRIEVDVHNCSPDVVAHNTKVELFFAPFGIGGIVVGLTPIPLSQSLVNIPPGGAQTVNTVWVNPITSVAFLARVSHPHDVNAVNNEGWHVVRVDVRESGDSSSPIFPIWNPFSGMRFIKVLILEEGPEKWFPQSEIVIGRFDEFLPVGELPDSLSYIIDGHLSGLGLNVPDTVPVGVIHISHLTAYALPTFDGPETLVGGVTYYIQIV